MRTRLSGLVLALLLALFAMACGGGGSAPPPDSGFDRLTARVYANNGSPVPGLEVRVEGVKTGITTDASGQFTLTEADFPNGITATNEIALGNNGVVVATKEVVPEQDPDITIQYGDSGAPGTGSGTATISGSVTDENGGAALADVQVTIFSLEKGIYQDDTDASGAFSIGNVEAGDWQLVAFKGGYYPEMAFLSLEDGQSLTYDVKMGAEGAVPPGEGIKVKGVLTDAKTGAPIAGATLSMTADTGYYGVPEPALYDDMTGAMGKPDATGQNSAGRGSSMACPFYYDPQYQETTSGADGSFEFANSVVGYAVYLNFNADGYFGGTWYENIDGRSEDLDLDLTLQPIVETDIHGIVKDGDGNPLDGAYVEFIYAGGFGGPMPMDGVALPPQMDLSGMAADGQATRENIGAPPPPPLPPTDPSAANGDGRGWEDATEGDFMAPATGGAGAPGAPGGSPDNTSFDNQFMQKFRFEHNNGRGTSSAEPFDGYLSFVTDADGKFDFEGVPAGPYYVFVSAYRHIPASGEFNASENAAENTPEYVLPEVPVGAVEGTVVDADTNEPVEDVLVNATQPNVDPFTYTDASGHFFIDNIPAGQWIVSAFKNGYLTVSQDVEITDGGVVTVSLAIQPFEAPDVELLNFAGKVYDGSKGYSEGDSELVGIASPTLVFTPVAPELGGYYRHVTGDGSGNFTVDLVNQTDYNLLIQATDFQDLYTRIWADSSWPKMDFGLLPVKGAPGGGGGGGVIVGPPVPGDPGTGGGTTPGGGGDDPTSGGGGDGTVPPPDSDPGRDPTPL